VTLANQQWRRESCGRQDLVIDAGAGCINIGLTTLMSLINVLWKHGTHRPTRHRCYSKPCMQAHPTSCVRQS